MVGEPVLITGFGTQDPAQFETFYYFKISIECTADIFIVVLIVSPPYKTSKDCTASAVFVVVGIEHAIVIHSTEEMIGRETREVGKKEA